MTAGVAVPALWMRAGVAAAGGDGTYPIERPDRATPAGGSGGPGGGDVVGDSVVGPLTIPDSGGVGGLPFTGFELLALVVVALVLVAAGAAALMWRRRRLA